MHKKIPKICTACRVSTAKIYLHHSSKIFGHKFVLFTLLIYGCFEIDWPIEIAKFMGTKSGVTLITIDLINDIVYFLHIITLKE